MSIAAQILEAAKLDVCEAEAFLVRAELAVYRGGAVRLAQHASEAIRAAKDRLDRAERELEKHVYKDFER